MFNREQWNVAVSVGFIVNHVTKPRDCGNKQKVCCYKCNNDKKNLILHIDILRCDNLWIIPLSAFYYGVTMTSYHVTMSCGNKCTHLFRGSNIQRGDETNEELFPNTFYRPLSQLAKNRKLKNGKKMVIFGQIYKISI